MTPAEHAAVDAAFRASITIIDEGFMADDPRIEAAHASLLETAGQHSMTMAERIRHMLAAADAVAQPAQARRIAALEEALRELLGWLPDMLSGDGPPVRARAALASVLSEDRA
jgi:hypothetical protein